MDHCRFKPEAGGFNFNKLNDGSGFVLAGGFNPNGKVNQSEMDIVESTNQWLFWITTEPSPIVVVYEIAYKHVWTLQVGRFAIPSACVVHIWGLSIVPLWLASSWLRLREVCHVPMIIPKYIMTISLPISNSHIAINMSHVSWLIFFVGWFVAWSISHAADGRIWFLTHTGAVYVVFKPRCHSILLMVVRPPY